MKRTARYLWRSRLPYEVAKKAGNERRKITQQEIADETGIRYPTVSAWMQYDTRLTRVESEVVGRFADWLGLDDPNDLLELVKAAEDEPTAAPA